MPHLITLLAILAVAMTAHGAGLVNPGFEDLDAAGRPVGWEATEGHQAGALATAAPHGGQRVAQLVGDGVARSWRQHVPDPETRLYRVSAWFRGQDLKVEGPEQYLRFYVHILYRDRPYADTTHVWKDIPTGTYDWQRLALRLTPQTEWPIAHIRVAIVGRFAGGVLNCDDLEFGPANGASGGVSILEWAQGTQPRVIADLAACQPASALAPRAKRGKWKIIPYEAAGLRGRMLWSSSENHPPALTLPLRASGWHAVYVGLADPAWLGSTLHLRLTRDPAPVPRSRAGGSLEEVFFKAADLTGQSLHIAQQPDGLRTGGGVAYVKLVPLTPEEVAQVRARRADASRRRLVTTLDGFSFIYSRRPTTREALLQEVEVYRDSDYGTVILQYGGADLVNYPSRVGEVAGQGVEVFDRTGDRYYAEAIKALHRQGLNPTQVLTAGAHDVGLKVHIGVRPGAWEHSPPLEEFFTSRFYREHPQWRCVDRDGAPVSRLSFAVPQVRARLVAVAREAVSFGADGASLIYVRGVPYVLYEKPVADLFRRRHGLDLTDIPETDPRVLDLRAEIMTTYMREMRAMLDEVGRQRGGARLQLSALVFADEADNRRYGLDLRQWAQQGLIDLVMPYLGAGGGSAQAYDMRFFRDVCGPARIAVKPTFVGWNEPDLNPLLTRARDLYGQGADGLTIWDGNSGDDNVARWAVVSRLGSLADIGAFLEEGLPVPVSRRWHRLGDVVKDGRYDPNWGY